MSLRNADDARHFLERFGLTIERRGTTYATNPEGRRAWRDTVYLTRKNGKQVRGYVFARDFRAEGWTGAAVWVGALSLVMFAGSSWREFERRGIGSGETPEALRREWREWSKLAKPFRAFLTADECKALN